MDTILEKWEEILHTIKTEHDISDISFDTWIRPLEVYGVDGNTLYFSTVRANDFKLSLRSIIFRLKLPSLRSLVSSTRSSLFSRNRRKYSSK